LKLSVTFTRVIYDGPKPSCGLATAVVNGVVETVLFFVFDINVACGVKSQFFNES
jgi:hypothetical protein